MLEAEARITVVSPGLTEGLLSLAETGRISWRSKRFSSEDSELIIAHTNDRQTNLEVKMLASANQLVNLADDPEESDFQVPSVMKRGKLTIAVSTCGPVRYWRGQMEQMFDEQYESYRDFLESSRKEIKAAVKDETLKRKLLREIADEIFLVADQREERFARLLDEAISEKGR